MSKDNIKSPSNRKTLNPAKKQKGMKEATKVSYPPRMVIDFTLDRETLEALGEVEARTGERRWDIVPRLIRLERVRLRKEESRKKATPEE